MRQILFFFIMIGVFCIGVFTSCQKDVEPDIDNVRIEGCVYNEYGVYAKILGYCKANISELGVCYSTHEKPTLNDFYCRAENIHGGKFTCMINRLELNTTYHVRTYAKNSFGVTYSDSILSFTTPQSIRVEAIDLGLSVKWANVNIGATNPEEFGDYFRWGVTLPVDITSALWKENTYGTEAPYTLLNTEDAAYTNFGSEWRMPTLNEIKELNTQCTWKREYLNHVLGYRVRGKNNNSIFLPAAGYYLHGFGFREQEKKGYYWTNYAYYQAEMLSFDSEDHSANSRASLDWGFSIRPVCPSHP